jgi:hypothetical protein
MVEPNAGPQGLTLAVVGAGKSSELISMKHS